MHKSTLIVLVFFTLVVLTGISAANENISKDEAFQIVIDDVLDGNIAGKLIYASEVFLTPVYNEITIFGEINLPVNDGWYFFIDDQPEMDWGHACRYVFVNNSGNTTVQNLNMPPENFEDMELLTPIPLASTPGNFHPVEGIKNLENAESTCYAVLISGGIKQSYNYPRYHDTISDYYNYLKTDLSYPEENIFVLYADGNDTAVDCSNGTNSNPDLDGDGVEDIDFACTRENLTKVFDTLEQKLGPNDYLFIYTYNHGGTWKNPGDTENATLCLWNSEIITDDEFANNVSKVNAAKMIVMGQCFAGGMVQELIDENTNIVVASSCGYVVNLGTKFLNPWLDAHKTGHDPDSSSNTEQDEAFDFAEPFNLADMPQYAEKPASFGGTVSLSTCLTAVPSMTPVTIAMLIGSLGLLAVSRIRRRFN